MEARLGNTVIFFELKCLMESKMEKNSVRNYISAACAGKVASLVYVCCILRNETKVNRM